MHDSMREKIKAIRDEAHRLEEGHGYPGVSVRSLAIKLGYDEDTIYAILLECAEAGFTNCLDHQIAFKARQSGDTVKWEFPSRDVCYWGPDQLRSRLDCVL